MSDQHSPTAAATASAAAALAGFDEAQLRSLITQTGYLCQALEADDHDAARDYAETIKDDLAGADHARRQEMIGALHGWIKLHANGTAGTMRELIGLEAQAPQPADTIGDALVRQCVDQAAAEQDTARRDELVGLAFEQLSRLPDLAVSRWRAEFGRLLDIRPREFDRLVRAARQGQRVDKPTEERRRIPTDDELADGWLRAHPHTAYALGEWRRYTAGHWPAMTEDEIKGEIMATLEAAKVDGVRPSARLLASVTELARISVAEPDGSWDADPDLLVMTNGTLQLSTRTLRHHSPADRITTAMGFAYDPAADCPTWRGFLAPVADAADFIQEFAGYSITTSTEHEIAVWLYGPPGSGKSTLVEGLLAMLGTRAGLLGLADIERSSFALSNLPGKTLMVSTEQPADFIRSGHVLNAIISGESVIVDRKFRDPITITPRAKLCWALNDLPRIAEAGSGLFRRVKVIAFDALSEEARDPGVKEDIRREGAGILNWAIEGLQRLRERRRFEIPACVRAATDDFQRKNDIAALFVAERAVTGSEERVQTSELYSAYRQWCEENGHKPKSSTAVADDWARLGFKKYRPGGIAYWRGLRMA